MLDYRFDFSAAAPQLKRFPPSGINVLICGGGLGGMFAAIQCYRKGHNVKVVESAKGFDNNGGIIRLGSSIVDYVHVFPGLYEAFELMDHDSVYTIFASNGDVIIDPMVLPKQGGKGGSGVNVHRAWLNRCLYEYARALGIEVAFDTRIASYFDDGEKGGCVSKTGEKFEADIVVAADGIASRSGDLIMNEGADVVTKSSGYAVFRSTYPAKEAYKIEHIEKGFSPKTPGTGVMQRWLAKDGYAMILTNDEIINFHIIHPDEGGATERWDQKTTKDKILLYLDAGSWSQDIRNLVLAAPDDAIFDWRLMFRNPKPNWVSEHGHVVQLGDAAHTFLPSSVNGATQALEDGVYLAACLQLASKSQIALGARVYNKLRFERTSCAQKFGFKNRDVWIGLPREEVKGKLKATEGTWIYKHNPEAYTYEKYGSCVSHLIAGTPFKNDNLPPGHKYVPWTMETFMSGKGRDEPETGDWN